MDLTTTYMGLNLKNPIVSSSSPLTENLDNFKKLEDAGAAAVVMHSLFEEQIIQESEQLDHYLDYGAESFAEALSYYPDADSYHVGPGAHLNLLAEAKKAIDIPIIASLNGISTGGWIDYAKKLVEAGADALELNIYYVATDTKMTGTQVKQKYFDILRAVKKSVSVPVAVKMNPFYSATANMAARLAEEGADALVLFNRFYQPDFDLEKLEVVPRLTLSSSYELSLPLRWVAILHGRVPVDFAITSGVHTHEDVLKGMMAGAKVTMMASELLQNGVSRIGEILSGVNNWMEENEYESIAQMQGSMSQKNVAEPAAFERANYIKVLKSYSTLA